MEANNDSIKNDVSRVEAQMKDARASDMMKGKQNQHGDQDKKKGKNDKMLYAGIVVVFVIAGILYALFGTAQANTGVAAFDNVAVNSSVLSELKSVAANMTLADEVGLGLVGSPPVGTGNVTPLVANGKPEILYIGANYCPFCAVTRWGFTLALMRFGNFSSLHYMTSSANDSYGSSPTFTFYNSSYSSSLIDFTSVELYENVPCGYGCYVKLQNATGFEDGLLNKYDSPTTSCSSGGCIPFIDFGNVSIQDGAPVSPQFIYKQTWGAVIANLTDINTYQSLAIIGTANIFTAQICKMTNNQPASVCDAQYIKRLA